MSKAPSQVLRESAELIARGWCSTTSRKGTKYCDPADPDATHFDLYGALFRTTNWNPDLMMDALNYLDAAAPEGSALLWEEKDGRTQAQVVALVRRASERAWRSEKEQAA